VHVWLTVFARVIDGIPRIYLTVPSIFNPQLVCRTGHSGAYGIYDTHSRAIQTRIRRSRKFKELDLRLRRDESEPSRCTVIRARPTGDFLESEATHVR
jgi:hypothetical protein